MFPHGLVGFRQMLVDPETTLGCPVNPEIGEIRSDHRRGSDPCKPQEQGS